MELSGRDRKTLRQFAGSAAALKVMAAELAEVPDADEALRQYWKVTNVLFNMRDELTALYVRLVYGEEG